jgi:hypothetical protein
MVLKSSSKEKPKKGSASRKKWLRIAGIVLLAILSLEFVLYFGANIFLANRLRQRVNESLNGVYELDFNRVHLSLIRRGIFLDGIVMKPIHPEKAAADQKLFELTLDELAFSGLWYNFFEQKLSFRKIGLDNPNFRLLQPLSVDSTPRESPSEPFSRSPVFLFENEIKKSVRQLGLSSIQVAAV